MFALFFFLPGKIQLIFWRFKKGALLFFKRFHFPAAFEHAFQLNDKRGKVKFLIELSLLGAIYSPREDV